MPEHIEPARQFFIFANKMIATKQYVELKMALEKLTPYQVFLIGSKDIMHLWKIANKGAPKIKNRYQILLGK